MVLSLSEDEMLHVRAEAFNSVLAAKFTQRAKELNGMLDKTEQLIIERNSELPSFREVFADTLHLTQKGANHVLGNALFSHRTPFVGS